MQPVQFMDDDSDPVIMNYKNMLLSDRNNLGRYLGESIIGHNSDGNLRLMKRIIMLPRVGKRSLRDPTAFKI
ncbi:unnamed protein product [Didymodactylos carnosus]|uniref:Uncharacterized protein n=1 Tax=Didymodactylos carnosus TaxID=1234261 RepID=A0A813P5V9_9BILA|nr:unnamed protein product [Didymodactylos carnosus]CAF3529792.1 unnamed protein product [Didymodactylos carnosus]